MHYLATPVPTVSSIGTSPVTPDLPSPVLACVVNFDSLVSPSKDEVHLERPSDHPPRPPTREVTATRDVSALLPSPSVPPNSIHGSPDPLFMDPHLRQSQSTASTPLLFLRNPLCRVPKRPCHLLPGVTLFSFPNLFNQDSTDSCRDFFRTSVG